ncbi:MAG: TonB-dependent receptor plug domain-containing protein [Chitinophagaceae bacterium]
MKIINNLGFLLFAFTCSASYAQNFADSNKIHGVFDTVKVNALYSSRINFSTDNIGQNIQVISREEFQKYPVYTTAEILSFVLGVDLRQRGVSGTQSDIQIQGSTFDQVLVMIDGVKMSDPQTGHHQMNLSISPEAIERIEIIKGASARRYGLNALAGVVNIVTRSQAKSQIAAQIHAGTNRQKDIQTGKLYANQGYRLFNSMGNKELSAWYDVAIDAGSGYRHNSDFQTIRSNFKVQQVIKNKVSATDGFKLSYSGGIIRNAFGANGFYAAPSDSNSYEFVHTSWGAIHADFETQKSGTFSARMSARANNDQYVFIKSNPAYYRNFHQTAVLNPELNYKYSRRYFDIGAGLEYRREAINSTNLGEHIREFSGFFADVLLKPVKGLRLSAGLYGLNNKVLGSKLYPGADVNLQVYKRIFLFVSFGTGQRLPTFTDLYYTGPLNLSNAYLLPERAMYYDFGLRSTGKRLQLHASVFSRTNDQLIDRIKDSLNAPWQPVNLRSFNIRGVEFNIKINTRVKSVLSAFGGLYLRASSGLSILESSMKNSSVYSQFTLNYLPLQWVSQLNLNTRKVGIAFNLRYLERNGFEVNKTNTYWISDFKLDYQLKIGKVRTMKIFMGIQNLGNTKYKEFTAIPLPGRWASFGVNLGA